MEAVTTMNGQNSDIRELDESALLEIQEKRIADAFSEIDRLRLWSGWSNFQSYCRRRWGIVRRWASIKHQESLGRGGVYFVRPGNRNLVKIGVAGDFETRIAALQTASPDRLRVLGVIHGADHAYEASLHRMFSVKRYGGEWFLLDRELSDFIEQHTVAYRINERPLTILQRLRELFEEMTPEQRDRAQVLWREWMNAEKRFKDIEERQSAEILP